MVDVSKYFIFCAVTIGIFSAMVVSMPSQFSEGDLLMQSYVPEEWRGSDLFFDNVTDADNGSITVGSELTLEFVSIGDDVVVGWSNIAKNRLRFTHLYGGWWIFRNWKYLEPHPLLRSEVELRFDEDFNASRVILVDDKSEWECMIYYNQTSYDNVTDAWDGGELNVWIGLTDYDVVTAKSGWSLLSSFLMFNSPNMHPTVNFLVAIPLWIMIAYCTYILIMEMIPFV